MSAVDKAHHTLFPTKSNQPFKREPDGGRGRDGIKDTQTGTTPSIPGSLDALSEELYNLVVLERVVELDLAGSDQPLAQLADVASHLAQWRKDDADLDNLVKAVFVPDEVTHDGVGGRGAVGDQHDVVWVSVEQVCHGLARLVQPCRKLVFGERAGPTLTASTQLMSLVQDGCGHGAKGAYPVVSLYIHTSLIDWLLGSTVVELGVSWVDGEVLEHFASKGSSLIARTWWFDATHDSDTIVKMLLEMLLLLMLMLMIMMLDVGYNGRYSLVDRQIDDGLHLQPS
ncbi:hypothetical protein H113_05084 [Trichophyton rubrum MR1459]|uniref:Uncharacterized protein n=1 Tax=Trichophyton rubrum (strain ATCC MYA-4607 / CBS 118892) TaxID=559305 RepID=A0A080WRY6_TRIRC|nr:uncharacterized protein TERG_11896 [Trichophyton rubrum CBS 118892]EZF94145.1 hypothetical protein H113_05084 [Trichophyton rubrum MR1459]EZG05129.1 hypothetical protein H106_04892 [Trichophyton rubrum CBS 735.88]KFL60963.1 hypothetical protein TERG_11896 [Trichophyton rubrum CBS 118892]